MPDLIWAECVGASLTPSISCFSCPTQVPPWKYPDPGLDEDPGHHLLTRQDEPQTSVERMQTLLSLISL